MRRFELVEGKSSKFWEIELHGDSFDVRWGRIGTNGQSQTKSFASTAKAQAEHDKLVAEKVKKGYAEVAGASSTAKPAPAAAKPTAAKPTAAKPAAATPAPTPAAKPAAPTAVPVEKPTTASVAVEGSLDLDDAFLANMLGVRGLTPAPRHDTKKARATLAAHVGTLAKIEKYTTENADSIPLAAIREAFSTLRSGEFDSISLEVAAAQYALVSQAQHDRFAALAQALGDLWVETRGLAWVFDAVVYGHRISSHTQGDVIWFVREGARRGLAFGYPGVWAPLRAHLASADDATYEPLRDKAVALRPSADDETALGLAFAFPEVGFAHDEARRFQQAGSIPRDHYQRRASVLASLTDAALAEELVTNASGTYGLAIRSLGGAAYGLEPTVATMLGLLRERAVGPLAAMLKSADGAEATKVVVDALSRIGTPEAIELLAKQADRRECVAGVAEAARRFPRAALGVLASVATSRSKASDAAQTLLKATLRRDGDALEDVIAALPEGSLKLCRKLLADTAPKEQASMDELPEVLAKPRWEGKRKAGPPTLKDLPEVAPPSASVWPKGLREKWKGHLKLRSWDEVAKSLRLDESMKRFVMDGDERGHSDAIQAYKKVSYFYGGHFLALGPKPVLQLARVGDSSRWYLNENDLLGFAGQFDLASLDFLLWWAGSHPANVMPALLPFADARIAPIAAAGLGKKTLRADAEAWLAAHPLHAAAGLLPVAFGKAGKARDAAMAGLRFLIARDQRAAIEEAARALGDAAVSGLEAVFGFDELDLLPSKMPSLPSFFVADALSPPILKHSFCRSPQAALPDGAQRAQASEGSREGAPTGFTPGGGGAGDSPSREKNGKALPTVAVERLGTMLSLSKEVTEPYAGIALVKEACTAESLAAFSWDLFQAWSVAGYPSKEQWAFVQLGWLGDDECARRLAPMLRVWPGESAHARAVVGLDVLMGIGSDVALMHLNGIAEKLKFKGLQEKAREKIAAIAEARGLTAVELADRLVPDLGLDDDGSLELDFGERRFRVGFDEALKPFVRDADGKALSDLPKPKKTDDADKSKAATDTWKALKKDARTIAGQQVARLELAMVDRRRWPLTTFRTFLVEHPLVGHLVRRLVWGVYEVEVPKDGSPAGGTLKQAFRVAEDRSFANADDDSFELDDDAWIGVVHPLELAPGDAAAFGQVFADYEILQPFVQLGRDLHTLTADEAKAKELERVEGIKVPTGRVLGLESRGWRRGDPQDGGGIWWMERRLPGLALTAVLELDPGIVVGDISVFPEQTLRTVYISNVGYVWRRERVSTLDEVPAIAMSELLRDLESLRG